MGAHTHTLFTSFFGDIGTCSYLDIFLLVRQFSGQGTSTRIPVGLCVFIGGFMESSLDGHEDVFLLGCRKRGSRPSVIMATVVLKQTSSGNVFG